MLDLPVKDEIVDTFGNWLDLLDPENEMYCDLRIGKKVYHIRCTVDIEE